MRALFTFVVLIMLAYAGFWFWELDQARKGFDAVVAGERAHGHRFDYSKADWGGFPSRMSVTLSDVVYEAGGLHVDAGSLTVEAYPWAPTHAVARVEAHPHLTYQDMDGPQTISIAPSLIIAGIRVQWSGRPDQIDVECRDAVVHGVSANGKAYDFSAARLQIDERGSRDDNKPVDGIDLAFSADQVMLGNGIKPLLGQRITSIRSSARLSPMPPAMLSWPPDWASIVQSAAKASTSASIARLDMDWGGVKAEGSGKLALDVQHRPDGAITFKVQNLHLLADALMKSGAIDGSAALLWALPALGVPVPITLTLKNGAATFGPFGAGHINPLK